MRCCRLRSDVPIHNLSFPDQSSRLLYVSPYLSADVKPPPTHCPTTPQLRAPSGKRLIFHDARENATASSPHKHNTNKKFMEDFTTKHQTSNASKATQVCVLRCQKHKQGFLVMYVIAYTNRASWSGARARGCLLGNEIGKVRWAWEWEWEGGFWGMATGRQRTVRLRTGKQREERSGRMGAACPGWEARRVEGAFHAENEHVESASPASTQNVAAVELSMW